MKHEKQELHLFELFNRIHRRLWRILSPGCRGGQLSMTEIFVLMKMHKLQSCGASALATAIGIPSSTLTGILDRLVEQGFFTRDRDPEDRRSITIRATAKVHAFVEKQWGSMAAVLDETLKTIPLQRKKRMTEDLTFLLTRLEQRDEESKSGA